MIPQIGDIYCVYSQQLQQYTACQVTDYQEDESGGGGLLAAVLTLDWTGQELPHNDQLHRMQPLVCNYFFWKDKLDHSYVNALVPPGYIYVGNISPLTTSKTNSYGGGWSNGDSVYRQRQWEQIDPVRRREFKEAADDYSEVQIGHASLPRRTHRLDVKMLSGLEDWSELRRLPCLTEIHTDRYDENLLAYLRSNPFLIKLSLSGECPAVMDLSGTHITDLSLNVDGVEQLITGEQTTQLHLSGSAAAPWTIQTPDQGRGMTLSVGHPGLLFSFQGLQRLHSLYVYQIQELDMQELIQRFPRLHQLRLWGKPGLISRMNTLTRLSNLHGLSTHDLFGFTGEEFPSPEQMPHLSSLWLSSLPADAAKSIKKAYKSRIPLGLDLSVTKPRNPQWLEENLHNPFRDWDGREHITTAHARKAAQLYKKMLSAIRKLDTQAAEQDIVEQLAALVTEYTEAFNKMDKRKSFIDTIEREEIYAVLEQLLDQAELRYEQQKKPLPVDREQLYSLFDELRDF
ncbi:hypothetical protein [Paenibacillus wulumuqiensis]|uniref:hypothetical protein n=1 Tax=Paenibacillus wulumuqiensis TaxID=1567107 RepID=UPI000619323B|nr:hypothetical protein [Paenibacillus wulumuqiensis]